MTTLQIRLDLFYPLIFHSTWKYSDKIQDFIVIIYSVWAQIQFSQKQKGL